MLQQSWKFLIEECIHNCLGPSFAWLSNGNLPVVFLCLARLFCADGISSKAFAAAVLTVLSSEYGRRALAADWFWLLRFVIGGMSCFYVILDIEDSILRQRALAMFAIIWRMDLPSVCKDIPQAIVAATLVSAGEIFFTMKSFQKDSLEMPWRVPAVLVFLNFLSLCFRHLQNRQWSALLEVQQ
jgi:hypothetical protein